jgi:nitroreductase
VQRSYASPVNVLDAVRRRRMHRSFSEDLVTDDELARLAWAGGCAPLAGNSATRRFVIVSDPRLVATLREVMPSFISNARACIVVCTDLALCEQLMGERGRDVVSRIDAGTAAENIALAAVELGLGVCFSQSSTEAAVREVLGLPDHVRPDIVVAVGRPAAKPSPAIRMRPPVVDRNRFGNPWA